MKDIQNYDKAYKEALSTKDPIKFINDRWGSPESYFNQLLVKDRKDLIVADIGAGLGRYTRLILPYSKKIYCIEPSVHSHNFLPTLSNKIVCVFPDLFRNHIKEELDLVFTFSTMLHFNLYEIWWYLKKISSNIKDNGYFVLHYASLENNGIELFAEQRIKTFGSIGRYFFHTTEQLRMIASLVRLYIKDDSTPKNSMVKGHKVITFKKIQ